jgi:ankyrin repeat protein
VFVEDPRGSRIQFIQFAAQGNFENVKRCLLSGEDVNAVDHSGCTALHAAAVANHFKIVELLLKNGADINARDKNVLSAASPSLPHLDLSPPFVTAP